MLSDRAKDFFEVMTKMKKMHTFCSAINGIPQGEFAMMALINSHDAYLDDGQIKGVSASKISRLLSMSKSSVSQMINSLEEKGLVERYTSRDDRRMVFIRITDLGKEKMKEAARFLNESSLSIRDVAARVGYDDPFYFDRLFRRFYGMTPRDYRRKLSSAKS